MMTHDPVDAPAHYRAGSDYETIKVLRAWLPREQLIGYLRGTIIKYQSRLGAKDDILQDAGKARWYSNYLEAFLRETKEGISERDSPTATWSPKTRI